ncbi:hypothetical protein PACTADRAFT_35363 [Pachysolen tannophilus NRRL Y-2460]|uniref:Ribosome maturation protein SDO1 n=1 Tax=Pachysolen tannophilus NRRL Y-2460 TaxID=669874 RepID=A0A1E4TPB7_PACTA|nr:hypothetical protein PACTADRAFT_35363 [Pachysolen tannophilus NRRL Y-2460]
MPINQPSNQIKLTNVSVVRMKRGKKRFEIACYQNKVQDWRSNVEKDLDEVLQIPQVFLNVSKGSVAPNDDLEKAFGTTDTNKIVMEILSKGEIQLSEKERQANTQQVHNEILQLISTKCVNPKTKKRYPPTMISKALNELKFNIVPTKTAKIQALDAIKILTERQIIPIARAKMKIKLTMDSKDQKKLNDKLKLLLTEIDDEDYNGNNYECISFIDPVFYREIVELLKNNKNSHIEVLDMAVIEEGDKNL